MGERFGRDFEDDPEVAAQFVLDCDGEYHGLDVVYPSNCPNDYEDHVFVAHSCGQIRDEIGQWFPEATPFYMYHLNGMSPLCSHLQELSLVMQDQIQSDGKDPSKAKKIADKRASLYSPCPKCGSKPGAAWHHEPLPQAVINWVASL